jgi:hypothetical protein
VSAGESRVVEPDVAVEASPERDGAGDGSALDLLVVDDDGQVSRSPLRRGRGVSAADHAVHCTFFERIRRSL